MYAIGIDIGGTSIKWGLIDVEGNVLFTDKIVTIKHEPAKKTIERLSNALNSFLSEHKIPKDLIKGIGVGCPGTVNAKEGIVAYSVNLEWENFPLEKELKNAMGIDVQIGNDANVAALGEVRFGFKAKYSTAIMLTLGTGVGGGVIIDNQIYDGIDGAGAELGHIVINYDGDVTCSCGRRGCLEAYASATGLIRQTKEAMQRHKDSALWKYAGGNLTGVDGRTAFAAFEETNDDAAKEVILNYVKYLSEGIMNLNNIFRPEVFILSGGIAKEGEKLIKLVKEYCKKFDYGYKNSPVPEITTSKLGYQSGIVGAAALIL